MTLAERVVAGDPRAIARAMSLIADQLPAGAAVMRDIFPRTGHAYTVGVTGPPGASKSTLVDRLVAQLRAHPSTSSGRADAAPLMVGLSNHEQPPTVGVIAVDPTSPFTGGAVLGD